MTDLQEELLKEIGPIFSQYVMDEGVVDTAPFSKEVDLNIDDIDTILKLHFLLPNQQRKDVIDFMKNLQDRIRRIKTTIKNEKERFEGGNIKGKIDFSNTLKERLTNNPFDKTVFICNMIDKNYNTPENLVLKTLLKKIQSILESDKIKEIIKNDYISEHWLKNKEIDGIQTTYKDILEGILEMNIYLRRINIEDEQVLENERMMRRVAKSRNDLYSDAANLLIWYKNLIIDRDIDSTEAKELLKNTFIKPKRMELLFELYWNLKIVDEFRDELDPNFKPIGSLSKENIIAEWEDYRYNYKIFHNSSAGLDFTFREDFQDIIDVLKDNDIELNGKQLMNTFVGRELKIMKHFDLMGDKIKLWNGDQPDIILKKINKETEEIEDTFIGEVKYSEKDDSKTQAKNGMKELLEYVSLVGADDDHYFERSEDLFQKLENVKGALFVEKETEVGKIEDTKSKNLEIVHYDDEENWKDLKKMLEI